MELSYAGTQIQYHVVVSPIGCPSGAEALMSSVPHVVKVEETPPLHNLGFRVNALGRQQHHFVKLDQSSQC